MSDDCVERVAFDLMKLIRSNPCESLPSDKDSVLNLYGECLTAVRGHRNANPATCIPLMGR